MYIVYNIIQFTLHALYVMYILYVLCRVLTHTHTHMHRECDDDDDDDNIVVAAALFATARNSILPVNPFVHVALSRIDRRAWRWNLQSENLTAAVADEMKTPYVKI